MSTHCSEKIERLVIAASWRFTRLFTVLGGIRFWKYRNKDNALNDALPLARGMTYKNALAELPVGGEKPVILDDNAADRDAVFRAHAHLIRSLDGQYKAAEDVGPCPTT